MPDRCKQREYCAIRVRGIVQGVGFRPFVFRVARRLGLEGTVANDGRGVRICLGGTPEQMQEFVRCLEREAPPAARINAIERQPLESPDWAPGFHILPSAEDRAATTAIAPDLATCPACHADILDPANRRHRYPFTNCTNCGPRFTITARIPYDRPNTSMRVFPMCAACRREYDNPLDRRFHAQPNACPHCGPQLRWCDADGADLGGDALGNAAMALRSGAVVAIKGLGGFHLAVDAGNNAAVCTLRARKKRPHKPLAVMVADLAGAHRLCRISSQEEELLQSAAHPIVLLAARENNHLAPALAPGLGIVGVMLAYTPLHQLLFAEEGAPWSLVLTSGNMGGSPICIRNDEALHRLRGLADYFLLHNRDILTRVDDSVLRVMAGTPRHIRRARGYAPAPLPLAAPCADTLACGAAMKNTFCMVRNNEAYLSQHIGTLDNADTFDFYRESITHLQEVLACTPDRIVCDRHPDYLSTRYAQRRGDAVRVQHHHAHALAVMAEHGLDEMVLALVLDGTGYGDDGTIFGGEFYLCTRSRYRRLASLAPLSLPGGDRAVLEPWRLALAWYTQTLCRKSTLPLPASLTRIEAEKRAQVGRLLHRGLNCPESSSAGRLFDAVSALLGLCLFSSYEGQAAMLLESQAALATPHEKKMPYPIRFGTRNGIRRIETGAMGRALLEDMAAGCPIPSIAWRFHHWLAESCRGMTTLLRQEGIPAGMVLAGGCMQNAILLEMLVAGLRADGMQVYTGEKVPMNDGGIALGQAYYTGDGRCV